MEQKPKVGVGVFIRRNGKILFIKRRGAHGEGSWGLVGGHLEFGETPEECAAREIAEETGLQVTNIQRLCFTNDIFKEESKHYVTLFMVADHVDGEPVNNEPEFCEAFEWFSWEALPQPLFTPVANLLNTEHNPFHI